MAKTNNRNKSSKTAKKEIVQKFKALYKTLVKEKITNKENAKEIKQRLIKIFVNNVYDFERINDVYYKTEDIYYIFKNVKQILNKKKGKLIGYSEDISIIDKSFRITTKSWFIIIDDNYNIIIYFAS